MIFKNCIVRIANWFLTFTFINFLELCVLLLPFEYKALFFELIFTKTKKCFGISQKLKKHIEERMFSFDCKAIATKNLIAVTSISSKRTYKDLIHVGRLFYTIFLLFCSYFNPSLHLIIYTNIHGCIISFFLFILFLSIFFL